ncbi:uncharacterized protein LOC142534238 isoform X4 [Primulina tabacum]|uniref:uncharacterized protein LOC142534238 isoform X4 n=1 Tax=Primulina tabacum TaxID=48773 RepID=UPI003F5A7A10
MSLTRVKMSEEVWLTCLTHALSTETEEIMGLLLGDIKHSRNGSVTAFIWGALPQPRSDRQKDRVETNPEQLTAASAQAERMTIATGTTTRVIGWYHSHPHITVLPSHVDVRTQAMYQLLDSGFVGLIFSCFSEDAQKVGRIQVTAFQSLDGKHNHVLRPVSVSHVLKSSVIDVESSLSSSDTTTVAFGSAKGENLEQDTGDSRATATTFKGGLLSNYSRVGNNSHVSSVNDAIHDLDPMDMSEGMQEAMHLSNLEMSGAEFVRKEIPLLVLPSSSLLVLDSPLSSFTNLQRVLYEEERSAYNQSLMQNRSLSPAMSALQDRLRENEIQLKLLGEEAKILGSELLAGNKSNSTLPRSPSHGIASSAHKDLYPLDSTLVKNNTGSRSRKGS